MVLLVIIGTDETEKIETRRRGKEYSGRKKGQESFGSKWHAEKLLELISTDSKVVRYRINIWKSVAFLNSNSEHVELRLKKKKRKNHQTFTLEPPKMRYLVINLTRYAQNLCEEN